MVLGTLYFFTLLGLVVKLIGDLLYVVVDPRVQFAARPNDACRAMNARRHAAAARDRGAKAPARSTSLSPNQRAWRRFRRNRLGFVSLIVFAVML